MKKKYLFLLTTILALLLTSKAFAATKSDILAELKTPVTVNGQSKSIPSSYVKMAADFLNSNDMTEEQLDNVMTQIQTAKSLVVSNGELNYGNMSEDIKNELQGLVANAVSTVDANVSVSDKNFTITSDTTNRTYTADNKVVIPIKTTGGYSYLNTLNYIIIANFFAIILSIITIKKFNLSKGF